MRRRRALYLSSSIGLGHVTRDLAIAGELRRLAPDLEILWLAAPPASDALRAAGESVLAEALQWRGASRIAERCMSRGRLDLVHYVYRSLPAWATNARLFHRVVRRYGVDIAVGDEAFEVDVPLVAHVLPFKAHGRKWVDLRPQGRIRVSQQLICNLGGWFCSVTHTRPPLGLPFKMQPAVMIEADDAQLTLLQHNAREAFPQLT